MNRGIGILRTTVVLLAAVLPASGNPWKVVTVDEAVGSNPSLELTSSGRPCISYSELAPNYHLKYASWDGSTWQIQIVDSDGGSYPSLALDSIGNPCISYSGGDADLRFAAWNGSAWDLQTVDSDGVVGMWSSLAFAESGSPGISYYDSTNYALNYAGRDGSSWVTEAAHVGDPSSLPGFSGTSLTFDTAANPCIAYCVWPDGGLNYARWNGSAWQKETVDDNGTTGLYSSLVLDSSGLPRISYGAGLRYASWNGSSWDTEVVPGGGGSNTSLALDALENPHISGYLLTGLNQGDVTYCFWDGGAWQVEVVDSIGDNLGTSLALDALGNPQIAYYSDDGLKYAVRLIDGDANGDWKVDSADLALWQSNYDPTGVNTNTFAMGDFDGDGLINSADLALWQSNYNPLGYMHTNPEPGTILLLGTGALCLAGITRRRLMN